MPSVLVLGREKHQLHSAPTTSKPETASAVASASPEMQRNMLGERLYPLIHQSQPELAGKITGMLLEMDMDNSELIHLLQNPAALNATISQALQVLEAHQAQDIASKLAMFDCSDSLVFLFTQIAYMRHFSFWFSLWNRTTANCMQ
jgi:hypothetical protein